MSEPGGKAAEIRAATINGYRQGLAQCAANLRAQAAAWRKGKKPKKAERFALELEQIAAHIEAEEKRRELDERKATAEAMAALAAEVNGAKPRSLADRLLRRR